VFIYSWWLTLALELTLNLVWLAVSLALLTVCGCQVSRSRADLRRGAAAVALVCLVCLLFPVISATDDLHDSGPALLETNKLKRLAPSAPAVLTLLPWLALHQPQENRFAAFGQPADVPLPSQAVLPFDLYRRPPPAQSCSVLS
jgi:hypothetical protein